MTGIEELPGRVNYFIGNDPRKWRKGIRTYSKVRYPNAYPGIDVIYYGNQQQLEYDFVVSPGADPGRIKLAFKGSNRISTDANGDLVLETPAGEVRQRKPVAYQEVYGERREIAANYHLQGDNVTFDLAAYDKNQPLIIDPALIYSSFLGGSGLEQGLGIAVDAQGSAYLTGSTASTDFPLVGAIQNTKDVGTDAFVTKVNPAGTALVYSTYLGGNANDAGNAIAVDAQGSAYVAGSTGSSNFPTTPGAFQSSKDGLLDGFVAKLSPSGAELTYSTFLGGDSTANAFGIAVDAGGRAYVVGRTDSTRFNFSVPLQRNGSPVYKSSDAAADWSASAAGLAGSGVAAFAIDPNNSGVIYAGSNIGVFKSATAGADWSLTGTNRPSTAPLSTNAVVIDPSNTAVVYAGASTGVYKSTDGGATYDVKNSGFLIPLISALAIDPSTPATLYAGTLLGIYKSTNGGDTWVEVRNGISGSSPRVSRIAIDPINPATVYMGTNYGMFKTTNGGSLWTSINAGALSSPFTPQITALAIDPLNPSTLYASGYNGAHFLFKTIDGGASWTVSDTGLPFFITINNLAIDPITPANLYAATAGAAVFKSTNGGSSWAQSNTGLANVFALAVAVDRNNPANVYAGMRIGNDAFAVRLNPAGSALEYLLSFGGNENDAASGVALDADGNAYIVGTTSSSNFPVVNAFQPALAGPSNAFVAKLNPAGTGFVYSTYLGGSGGEQGLGIAVYAGSAYVVGQTSSQNFPLVNPIKSTLAASDPADAFVTKLSSSGLSLDFSTYLGGSSFDQAFGIAIDLNGGVYVTGATYSSDFPTVGAPQPGFNGYADAFVTKLNSSGTSLVYSTYLGGADYDEGNGIAVDSAGNAYVVGTTYSADFPTVRAFQSAAKGGADVFVTKIGVDADLSISKTHSRDPVMVNNPLTYTLKVYNAGPSPATGVKVTDMLPAKLTFGSATSSLGSCSFNNPTVTCDLGDMPVAGSAVIAIAVTPTQTGTITNTASVTANEPDSNPGNNSATEITKISASPSINGSVKDANGNGVSGVLMSLTGTQTATILTDGNGFYQFAELPIGGNYVITPTKSNLSFEPRSQTLDSLNADQTTNFVANTCTYYIFGPAIQSFGPGGGSGSFYLTSLHDCPWTAISSASWITITSPASGAGSGTINFSVSAATAPRAGHITVAGQNFAIYQEFNPCATPAFSIANYNLSFNATMIRTADLNGGGLNDLVAVNTGVSGGIEIPISVLLNDGNGGFRVSNFGSGFGGVGNLVVGDFNGDGKADIATVGSYGSGPFVRIYFNDGSGGFGQSIRDIPFASSGPSFTRLFTGDVNRDGKADFILSAPESGTVQVLLGNGSGGFTQMNPVNVGVGFAVIGIADFNNDGIPDLLLARGASSTPLAVMLGDGGGGFGPPIVSGGIDSASTAAIGDFDEDGKPDLVVPTTISTISPPSTFSGLVVMKGDGAGHFTPTSRFSVDRVSQLTVADLNNDGKTDIAFTAGGSKVTILLGDGLGGFANPIQVDTGASDTTGGNFGIVATAFSGSGETDLAVADYSRGASVLRNNCAAAPSISGRVTDSRTSGGLFGVTIALTGAQAATTQTDGGGNFFFSNLTVGANYVVTPSKDNFRFNPMNVAISNLAGIQTANFVGTPITLQFTSQDYVVDEGAGSIQIGVRRTGDLSGVTTVDYATVDGTASARTDYTAAYGTLRFGPGESVKSFVVLIIDDNRLDTGKYLTLTLSNPVGAIFNRPMEGPPPTSVLEILESDFIPPTTNPLDDPPFFVRQHYYDFLNRLPDQPGLDYWTSQITQCGNGQNCIRAKRIDVSNAFFYELEYQQTGAYVYRLYRAAFGGNQPFPNPDTSNAAEAKKVPSYAVFAPDRARVVGGANLAQGQLDVANAFVQRAEFLTKYPATLDGPSFVDAVLATIRNDIGVDLGSQRSALIDLFNQAGGGNGGRANLIYRLADDNVQTNPINNRPFIDAEYDRAFVATQYFGYLRRDSDIGGFLFWLNQVSSAPLRDTSKQHAMVCSFITSAEYQQRFSTVITHTNSECPQ